MANPLKKTKGPHLIITPRGKWNGVHLRSIEALICAAPFLDYGGGGRLHPLAFTDQTFPLPFACPDAPPDGTLAVPPCLRNVEVHHVEASVRRGPAFNPALPSSSLNGAHCGKQPGPWRKGLISPARQRLTLRQTPAPNGAMAQAKGAKEGIAAAGLHECRSVHAHARRSLPINGGCRARVGLTA
jgi:hypothetical protein